MIALTFFGQQVQTKYVVNHDIAGFKLAFTASSESIQDIFSLGNKDFQYLENVLLKEIEANFDVQLNSISELIVFDGDGSDEEVESMYREKKNVIVIGMLRRFEGE